MFLIRLTVRQPAYGNELQAGIIKMRRFGLKVVPNDECFDDSTTAIVAGVCSPFGSAEFRGYPPRPSRRCRSLRRC